MVTRERFPPPPLTKWLDGLYKAIDTLQTRPLRCPFAAESDKLPEEIHELLHGKREQAATQAPDHLHRPRGYRLRPLCPSHRPRRIGAVTPGRSVDVAAQRGISAGPESVSAPFSPRSSTGRYPKTAFVFGQTGPARLCASAEPCPPPATRPVGQIASETPRSATGGSTPFVSVRRTGQTTTRPTPARPGIGRRRLIERPGRFWGDSNGWRRFSVPIISRWIGSRRLATARELVRWPAEASAGFRGSHRPRGEGRF